MSYFSWDSSRIIALVVFLAVSLVGAKREIDEFFYDNLYASKEMITQAHVPEETHPQEQEQRQQQQQMTRRIKAQMRANHGTSLLQTNDEHTMPVHWQNMINAAQLAVERKVVSFKVDQEQKNKAAIAAAKAHAKAESMSKAQEIQNKISLMQKQIQIEKKKVKKMQSFIQIRDQQKKAVAKVQAKSKALQVSEKDKYMNKLKAIQKHISDISALNSYSGPLEFLCNDKNFLDSKLEAESECAKIDGPSRIQAVKEFAENHREFHKAVYALDDMVPDSLDFKAVFADTDTKVQEVINNLLDYLEGHERYFDKAYSKSKIEVLRTELRKGIF